MPPRHAFAVVLALLTAGCLNLARLDRPLPSSVEPVAALDSIEITNESGDVVLSGRFSTPASTGAITTRVATLAGAGSAPAGSATFEAAVLSEGALEETLQIDVDGLRHPSLYRVRIDQKDVTVFSTTLSDQVSLFLSRRTTGR